MKIKFNKFERIAGIFVATAIVGSIAGTISVAVKKGWFASKVKFETTVESADGIHNGTIVQMAGLRAGSVTDVELLSSNEIRVQFQVFERFHPRVRADSKVRVLRPFIIGEKVIDVTVGTDEETLLPAGSKIASENTVDMMDLFSGKKLGPLLGTLDGLMKNMKILADAFADESRMKSFVRMFDKMNPLIENLNVMAIQVSKLAKDVNKITPEMLKANPQAGQHLGRMISDIDTITKNMAPAMEKAGPKLPEATIRTLEALDEMVVVLKALQKSFLLSGNAKEVREEEQKTKTRKPSGK